MENKFAALARAKTINYPKVPWLKPRVKKDILLRRRA